MATDPLIDFGDDEAADPGPDAANDPLVQFGDEPAPVGTPTRTERTLGAFELGVSKSPFANLPPVVAGPAAAVGAALLGVDPFRGRTAEFLEAVVTKLPGIDATNFRELEAKLEGSSLAGGFELAGNLAAEMGPAVGAFQLGRAAATQVAARLSPTAAQFLNQGITSQVAARIAKPDFLRAAEILGGSTGFAGFEFGRELAGGATVEEAAGGAKFAFKVGALGETGLTAVGRTFSTRARQANLRKLAADFETTRRRGDKVIADKLREAEKLNDQLDVALRSEDRILSLARSRNLGRQEVFQQLDDLATKVQGKESALRQTQAEARGIQQFLDEFPSVQFTRDVPLNPDGIAALWQKGLALGLKSPTSFSGQMGPSFGRIMEFVGAAEAERVFGESHAKMLIKEAGSNLRRALGTRDRKVITKLFDQWERLDGGEDGVRRFMAQRGRSAADTSLALDTVRGLSREMSTLYDDLVRMGAEPALTSADLAGFRVANYLPHVREALPEGKMQQVLTKRLGAERASLIMEQITKPGLAKFGSIDFNRTLSGSTQQKITQGLPLIDDPLDAMFEYMRQTHYRVAYGKRFGFRGELTDQLKQFAVDEGASVELVNILVDSSVARNYYGQATRDAAALLTSAQAASKLTFSAIPNMGQTANTATMFGTRALVRGMGERLRPERREFIMRGVALGETLVRGMADIWRERASPTGLGRLATAARRTANFTMNASQFTRTEAFNRTTAGFTGDAAVRDMVAKGVAGRLRGETLSRYRRIAQSMGFDLDRVVLEAKAAGGTAPFMNSEAGQRFMRRAVFAAAEQTQFVPTVLGRPTLWQHPVGRVITQFKTFGFRQSKFLLDNVLGEAAQGNLAPLGRFLSIYPVAGELVRDVRSLALAGERARDPDNLAFRFLEDIIAVGGLGMMMDLYLASESSRTLEFAAGPTAADLARSTQEVPVGAIDNVLRQPLATAAFRFYNAGEWTADVVNDYLDSISAEEDDAGLIDFGELRQQERGKF